LAQWLSHDVMARSSWVSVRAAAEPSDLIAFWHKASLVGALNIRAFLMSKAAGPTRDIFDAGGRGMRHKGLRQANEKTVLTVVGFNSGVSNAEISRMSGLAPQTVSAILANLERDGMIERGPALRGRRGQPATPILLKSDGGFAIGVELGRRHADIVLLNMHAQVLGHRHVDYAYPDATTIFDTIGAFAAELREALPVDLGGRLLDLGLAMPGRMADSLDRAGMPEGQAALWRQVDVEAELADRTGLEIFLYNDGNAACWAELIALPQPRPANIIYFLVSDYVGAGVVGDGVLWSGPTGNAANLGSMLVQLDGHGPVHAHSIASLDALCQRLAAAGKPHDLAGRHNWDWTAIEAELEAWIADGARALVRTAFNASTMVEAPLVIIDSVLAPAITDRLAARFSAELAALPVRGFEPPMVVKGRYGAMAPAIGAAELPLFARYF
jgi:predicted NBD/HSP70 family sugar kinase